MNPSHVARLKRVEDRIEALEAAHRPRRQDGPMNLDEVTPDDVWSWPEFQQLAKRLGINTDKHTVVLAIALDWRNRTVLVSQEYAPAIDERFPEISLDKSLAICKTTDRDREDGLTSPT